MAKIVIHQNYSAILDEIDLDFLRKLDTELSFDVQGAEHMTSFKGYYSGGKMVKWDGKQRLLTSRLTFPSGLIERVKDFYFKNQKSFEIEDLRQAKTPFVPFDILPKLKSMGKDPRYYQLEAVEACKKYDRGVIKMGTGAGKTQTAGLITSYFNSPTAILVIGKDLLYQLHASFSEIFDQPIGMIGDGVCDIQKINIVSIWTLGQAIGLDKKSLADENTDEKKLTSEKYQKLREYCKTIKLAIFDECHMSANATIQAIVKNMEPEYIYGMSASPWRDDNADLMIEAVLGKKIIDISASELIEGGYLVKPKIKFVVIPKIPGLKKQPYQTIYKTYITDNAIRNNYIVQGAKHLADNGYPTLILYNTVNHGEILFEQISKLIPSVLLSGKDTSETREEAKRKLESGEIKCILASKIWDIGLDLCCISGLVNAGGGAASARNFQKIGRALRKFPGKTHAMIIDFVDQAPFLLDHSKDRYKIYSSEPAYEINWPGR